MSEPFWKGKTREELEGLPVRVKYASGAMLTGCILKHQPTGAVGIWATVPGGAPVEYPFGFVNDEAVLTKPYIESVTLLEDLDCEYIANVDDLQEGDLIATFCGNRYLLTGGVTVNSLLVESLEPTERIDHSRSRLTIPRTYFAYGLRRKPQLPDKPGLWMDKDGDVWLMMTEMMRRISIHGKWCCCDAVEIAECSSRAPFRPYKPEENE